MKTLTILKLVVVLPVVFYVDYLLLAIIGCASHMCGAQGCFFCGPYCIFCKLVIGLSLVFVAYIVYPNLFKIFTKRKSGEDNSKK